MAKAVSRAGVFLFAFIVECDTMELVVYWLVIVDKVLKGIDLILNTRPCPKL